MTYNLIDKNIKYIIATRGIIWEDCLNYDYVYGLCEIIDSKNIIPFSIKHEQSEQYYLKITGEKGEVIIPGSCVYAFIKTKKEPKAKERDKTEEIITGITPSWREEAKNVLIL